MYIKISLINQFHTAKNKSVSHIQWLDEKDENIVQYCNHYETGEICLSSKSFLKYSSFPRSNSSRVIASNIIKTDKFGNIVLGLLNSGEILLQHRKIKKLVMGLDGFSVPTSSKQFRVLNPLESLQNFKKQYLKGDEESCDKEENKKELKHQLSKPLIFASKDLSIILLLTNYSEIYVWTQNSLGEFFSNYKGEWNTFKIPKEIPMPKSENKGASIDVSFILKESTEISCIICFSFMEENTLVISSFHIHWLYVCMTRINSPLTKWRSETIMLRNKNFKLGESWSQRISIVSKFAFMERILCLAVNSFSTQFDMIYFCPDRLVLKMVKIDYPNISCSISKRSRWVSSLNWTQDNQVVIGLTRSGHIFLTSRFGVLLSIHVNDVPSNQIPATFVHIFPNLSSLQRSQEKNNISGTPALGRMKVLILTHPQNEVVTLSRSGCFCQVVLSKEVSSAVELGTFLLKQTHQLNHKLEVSCVNHTYEYIQCSNSRLAAPQFLYLSHVKNDMEVQVTFEHLETSWSFLSSVKCCEKKAKLLATPLVSECLRFFRALLVTSSANDDDKHQIRLVQCLRFFHHLVKQVSSVVCSFFVMRPLLQMMFRFIDLVLESVRSTSIQRKLICFLILTQTLNLFADNLVNGNFSSIIENNEIILRSQSETINLSFILDIHMRPIWFRLRKQLEIMWDEKGIQIIEEHRRALRLATIIIQEHIRNDFPPHPQIQVTKAFKSVSEGQFQSAVERMKKKLESKMHSNSPCGRKLKKIIFFIFFVLFSERDWKGLGLFISWVFHKLWTFRSESKKRRYSNVLQQIFRSLLGNLGILLAKLALEIPVLIPSNFSFYDYSCHLDNPPSDCILVSSTDDEKSIIFQMALRCLCIGQKYNTLLHLAKHLGDSRLALLCLLMMQNTHRGDFDLHMHELLFTLLSSNMRRMWNLDFESFNLSPPSARPFIIIERVLYFSLLVDQRGLLLKCFRICLDQLHKLVQDLPLNVPWSFPLPAAPIFCPQFETIDEIDMKLESDEETQYMDYFTELRARKKLSILMLQICFLCIASKTCGVLIRSTIEEGIKNEYKLKEMMAVSRLLLLGKEDLNMTEDEEWKELKRLWKVFLSQMFLLHERDRFAVVVRGWVRSKANIYEYKSIQEKSLEVLRVATHLSNAFGEPRNEIFSIVLSSLQDSAPSVEVAQLLADVMSRQEQVPSLLKERFNEVLERWKEVPLDTQDMIENSKMTLFEFYELKRKRPSTDHEGDRLYPLSKENIDVLLMFTTTVLSKLERKFFVRETEFPFLYQFSDRIKFLEFEGMNLLNYFSNLNQTVETNQCERSLTDFSENNTQGPRLCAKNKQKKGLFRNIARITPWKRSFAIDTPFVLYDAFYGLSRHTLNNFNSSCQVPRNKKGVNHPIGRPARSFHLDKTKKRRATTKFHFEKGLQTCKSLSDVIKSIYNCCINQDFNFSLLSKDVLFPVTWIFRNDKILSDAFLPQPQDRLCPLFSGDDIKRIILWHCSTSAWNKNQIFQDINSSSIDSSKINDFCQGLQLEVEGARTSSDPIQEEERTLRVKEVEEICVEQVSREIDCDHRNLSPSCNPTKQAEETDKFSSDSVSNGSLSTDLALMGRCSSSLPADKTIPWQPFVIRNERIMCNHFSFSQTEESSSKLEPITSFPMATSKETKLQEESLKVPDTSCDESKYLTSSENQQICNPLCPLSLASLRKSPHQLTDNPFPNHKESMSERKQKTTYRINTNSALQNKSDPKFRLLFKNSSQTKLNPPLLFNLSYIIPHSSNGDEKKEWYLKKIPQKFLQAKTPTVKLKNSLFAFLKTPTTSLPFSNINKNLDSKVPPFHLHQEIWQGKMTENISSFQLLKSPLKNKSPATQKIYKTPVLTSMKLKGKLVKTHEKQKGKSKFDNGSQCKREEAHLDKDRTDHCFLEKTSDINLRIKDKREQIDSEKTIFISSVQEANEPILKNERLSLRSYVSRKTMTDNKQMEDKWQQTDNEFTYGEVMEDFSLQVNIEEINKTAVKYGNEYNLMQREKESRDILVDVKKTTISDNFTNSKEFSSHSFDLPPLLSKTQVNDPSKTVPIPKENLCCSIEKEIHTVPSVRREVAAFQSLSKDDIRQSDNTMEITSSETQERTHSSPLVKSQSLATNKIDAEKKKLKIPNSIDVSDDVNPLLSTEAPSGRKNKQSKLSEEGSSINEASVQPQKHVSPTYLFEESNSRSAETRISKPAKYSNLPTDIPIRKDREIDPLCGGNDRETKPLPESEYVSTYSPYREVDESNSVFCCKDNSSEDSPKDLILSFDPTTIEQDSIQDILNQFVLGLLSIDQVFERLSTYDLDPLQLDHKGSIEENSAPDIHQLLESVNKIKCEISSVKTSLSEVAKFTDKHSERNYDKFSYFEEKFHNDSDKALLPEKETPEELLKYINRISPNRLAEDEISWILKAVEKIMMKEGDIDSQSVYPDKLKFPFEEDSNFSSPCSENVERGGSSISNTSKMNLLSSHKVITNPIFNLGLSSARDDSATCPSSSAVSHLEERRRKEIRTWMQRAKSERSDYTSSSDRTLKFGGKVNLRRTQMRDQRRVQLRKENAQKRKESFGALLEECSQENKKLCHILKRTRIFTQSTRIHSFDVINTNNDKNLNFHKCLSRHSENSSPSKITGTKMGPLHVSSNLARAAIHSSLQRLNKVISSSPVSERRDPRLLALNSVNVSRITPDITRHQQNSFTTSQQKRSLFDTRFALDRIPEVDTPLNHSSTSSLSSDSTWCLPEEIKRILN